MRLRSGSAVLELGLGILITSTTGCGNSFQAGPAGYSDSDGGATTPDSSVMTTDDSGNGIGTDTGSTIPIDDSGFLSADGFALDGAPDPTCDPKEQPGDGVFVSSTVALSGDGSAALPLKTIAEGLSLASAAQKATVYLDQGTYAEQVKFIAQHSGFTVQGGFRRVGAAWERDCSNNAPLKAVIASPTNVGVTATSLTKRSVLRLLSVFSKAAGDSIADQGGQSCYGVAVSGEGTALALEDVIIKVGAGGAGGMTTATVAGSAPSCAPDSPASCSDGVDGAPGPAVAKAIAGSFPPDGYLPGNGVPGQPGQPGHNGKPGSVGEAATCYAPGCSGGGALCSVGLFCGNLGANIPVAAGPGTCGCGGKAGSGGGAGHGGGASIGVFAAAKATVVLTRTQIQTSSGGNGSAGSSGTSAVAGTAGQQGKDATCPGTCASVSHGLNCNCEQPSTRVLKGGAPNGSGGTGGKGSDGTGGSGGPSFGIVRQGSAVVSRDAMTTIKVGEAGKGVSAPDGSAAEEQTAP